LKILGGSILDFIVFSPVLYESATSTDFKISDPTLSPLHRFAEVLSFTGLMSKTSRSLDLQV